MLAIIFLIAISLFIPTFWLVTIAYTIYLVLTTKARRNKIIFNEIMQCTRINRGVVLLDYLFFESAKSFAIDHGVMLANDAYNPDKLVVNLNVAGEVYKIIFQRGGNNGTLLSVSKADVVKVKDKTTSTIPVLLRDSA